MAHDFLRIEDVVAIHHDQIEHYGGSFGLRDAGLLESAVETARATFGGHLLHDGVMEIAAAYLFHLVKNHPFVDGNKRVGAATALVFLDMHGFELDVTDDMLADHVLGVANGSVDKAATTEFIRRHAKQIC